LLAEEVLVRCEKMALADQEIIYLGKQIQKDWQRLKRSNEGVTMTNAW